MLKKGDKVKLLKKYEGQRFTVEAGSIGTVTGILGQVPSVRFNGNLWFCDPQDLEKQQEKNDENQETTN